MSSSSNVVHAVVTREESINLFKRRLLSFIPFIFALAAFCCSYTSNFDNCTNISFIPQPISYDTDTTLDESNDFFSRPHTLSYGLWMYQQQRMTIIQNNEILYNEYCTGYDAHSIHIDTKWMIARLFSVIGIILSGFLLLWQFLAPFLLFDTNYWRIAILLFTILATFQGITLLFTSSSACYNNTLIYIMAYNPKLYPTECTWDTGTHLSIASTALYVVTVISMYFIPAPGTRPKERPFPMMVWDTATKNGKTYDDDDDEDDDDDSVSSFAGDEYDLEIDDIKKYKQTRDEDITETDVSYSSHASTKDDLDDDLLYIQSGIKV